MMENPIPMLQPELQHTFLELEGVKIAEPKATPRPTPEPELQRLEDEQKEPVEDSQQTPQIEMTPITPELRPKETLGDLSSLEKIFVTRQLQVKGMLLLKGKRNFFFVKTPGQNLIYTVVEENRWWVGYFCYGLRPLILRVLNSEGCEVIRISRPYNFTTRILPCQLQRIRVFSPPGRMIGVVDQQWAPIRPLYTVKDSNGVEVFNVIGPKITVSCCQDVQFRVMRPDGTLVAATSKRWEGLLHALLFAPVTDKFSMTFYEKEMNGEEKALLLATALLLTYMYYDV